MREQGKSKEVKRYAQYFLWSSVFSVPVFLLSMVFMCVEATILELDENPHFVSSTEKLNLDQQMHASVSGEEKFYGKIHYLTYESQQNHGGHLDGQFKNMQSYLDYGLQWSFRHLHQYHSSHSRFQHLHQYHSEGKLQRERHSQFKHLVHLKVMDLPMKASTLAT